MITFLVFLGVVSACVAVCLTMWGFFRSRVKDSIGLLDKGFPKASMERIRLAMGLQTLFLVLFLTATFVFLW